MTVTQTGRVYERGSLFPVKCYRCSAPATYLVVQDMDFGVGNVELIRLCSHHVQPWRPRVL